MCAGISCSTSAPLAIWPTVGWFFWTVAPPPPSVPAEDSAEGQRALRHGINLPIRAQQRRLQQHPALQRRGVAHRGHRHIQPGAGLFESGNVRRHHDNGDVFRGQASTPERSCHSAGGRWPWFGAFRSGSCRRRPPDPRPGRSRPIGCRAPRRSRRCP